MQRVQKPRLRPLPARTSQCFRQWQHDSVMPLSSSP
jgi:hypothetical protein